VSELPAQTDLGDLRAVVERAESGAAGGVQELREYLARWPAAVLVLERMVPAATEAWLRARANGSPVRREVSEREVRRLREMLSVPGQTGLEELVIEQVVVGWLELDVAETMYARTVSGTHTRGDERYWSQRVDGSHRRYLRACKTLAEVRRRSGVRVVRIEG
jgi:hypothetical protein